MNSFETHRILSEFCGSGKLFVDSGYTDFLRHAEITCVMCKEVQLLKDFLTFEQMFTALLFGTETTKETSSTEMICSAFRRRQTLFNKAVVDSQHVCIPNNWVTWKKMKRSLHLTCNRSGTLMLINDVSIIHSFIHPNQSAQRHS